MSNIDNFNLLIKEFDISNINENFNPKIRDQFIKKHAMILAKNSKVIDVSSGCKPYASYFSHCDYTSHEFGGNKSVVDELRGKNKKKQHDIISPIDDIPVKDNSFDCVLCTEVFEHIPEPIKAMKELVRICKPGGKILITAPFMSGVHQEPYHFYAGFSPFFYNFLKEKYNLIIKDFKSQGDLFLLINQELGYRTLKENVHSIISKNPNYKQIYANIIDFIHKYTLHMSENFKNKTKDFDCPENMLKFLGNINKFTIGYCVAFQTRHIHSETGHLHRRTITVPVWMQ